MIKNGFRVEFRGEKDEFRGEFSNFTNSNSDINQGISTKQYKNKTTKTLHINFKTISNLTMTNKLNREDCPGYFSEASVIN
jgi:hypothetical protein